MARQIQHKCTHAASHHACALPVTGVHLGAQLQQLSDDSGAQVAGCTVQRADALLALRLQLVTRASRQQRRHRLCIVGRGAVSVVGAHASWAPWRTMQQCADMRCIPRPPVLPPAAATLKTVAPSYARMFICSWQQSASSECPPSKLLAACKQGPTRGQRTRTRSSLDLPPTAIKLVLTGGCI